MTVACLVEIKFREIIAYFSKVLLES